MSWDRGEMCMYENATDYWEARARKAEAELAATKTQLETLSSLVSIRGDVVLLGDHWISREQTVHLAKDLAEHLRNALDAIAAVKVPP